MLQRHSKKSQIFAVVFYFLFLTTILRTFFGFEHLNISLTFFAQYMKKIFASSVLK